MADITSNALTKMTIQAYSNCELTTEIAGKTYTALVNPSQYTQTYKIEYVEPEILGGNSKIQYKYTPSSDFDLEFLFDSTGIIKKTEANPEALFNIDSSNIWGKEEKSGVEDEIKQFLAVVYDYNGEDHKPNYLKISWGAKHFNCMLTEVAIEYKLFNADGGAIRAVAKAKFKRFIDDKLLEAEEKKSSPDLTHVRIVNEGDTLPLMTQKIYGDSKYYLEVARVNKLTTFRKLKTGQRIYFPPLQKPQ